MDKATKIRSDQIVQDETLKGGNHWSFVLKRGYTLRLTDLGGNANVSALFFNREERLERYNMADTLKAQHIAYLTQGNVCYSDMGRILISITADTCGWHDTLCGCSNAALVERKYGLRRYQEWRNDYYRNGRDSFLIELGKWGLGKRDQVANVNFFSKVGVDERGNLGYQPSNSRAGDYVDLRAEMNVIVVLNSCPHPLDPRPDYAPGDVQMTVWKSGPAAVDDPCRLSRPENGRGFANTELYFKQHSCRHND
jgi:urea carboxylase-associated protein 2